MSWTLRPDAIVPIDLPFGRESSSSICFTLSIECFPLSRAFLARVRAHATVHPHFNLCEPTHAASPAHTRICALFSAKQVLQTQLRGPVSLNCGLSELRNRDLAMAPKKEGRAKTEERPLLGRFRWFS